MKNRPSSRQTIAFAAALIAAYSPLVQFTRIALTNPESIALAMILAFVGGMAIPHFTTNKE